MKTEENADRITTDKKQVDTKDGKVETDVSSLEGYGKPKMKPKCLKENPDAAKESQLHDGSSLKGLCMSRSEGKRMASIEQKRKERSYQDGVVQHSLAALCSGGQSNKRIVYPSDSEDETMQCKLADTAQKRQLFVNESPDEENDDFRTRPQYEGKAGQKLLKAQSKFDDDRFKMDERFLEEFSDSGSEREVGESQLPACDLSDEKKRNFAILRSVLGTTANLKIDANKFKKVDMLHFDPSKEEHKKFQRTSTPKAKIAAKTKNIKQAKQETNSVEPEVSKERFFDVTDDLKQRFSGEGDKHSHAFSLSSTFQNAVAISTEGCNDSISITKQSEKRPLWMEKPRNPFKYDSSSEEEGGNEDENTEEIQAYHDKKNVPESTMATFFFLDDDRRIKEGIDFFHRKEEYGKVRKIWMEKRPDLVQNFKSSRKRSIRRKSQARNYKTFKQGRAT